LASNIIEVGIDINRLSLMTIVSQPKSTAQYIQVSGRVGRDPLRKPGLVVTIYTSNRPRDLSHFEHFRSYHEKLYAQVEPTSVTPFSAPVIKRALRGAAVAYLRMVIPMGTPPKEVDSEKLIYILNQLRSRADRLNLSGEDLKILDAEVQLILKEWNVYRADEWGAQEGSPNGLLTAPSEDKNITGYRWVIPVSMRNVDASVELEISRKYRLAQMNDEEPINV
jgi:superfamily II DNA/RNA helicase